MDLAQRAVWMWSTPQHTHTHTHTHTPPPSPEALEGAEAPPGGAEEPVAKRRKVIVLVEAAAVCLSSSEGAHERGAPPTPFATWLSWRPSSVGHSHKHAPIVEEAAAYSSTGSASAGLAWSRRGRAMGPAGYVVWAVASLVRGGEDFHCGV